MPKTLWQILYKVDGLVPRQVKLKRRVWLKKGEILLEKGGDSLEVHVLHEGEHTFGSEDKLMPYLKFFPLLSNNSIHVEGGAGFAIASEKEFGRDTNRYLHADVVVGFPDEAIEQIEKHAPQFLRQLRKLHDSYIEVLNDNAFLSIAVDFLFEANNKSVFRDESFLNAVICLEALFNEGPSDISYKIAHRAAFLIGLWRGDPLKVFNNMKAIYRGRNRLAHGRGSLDAKHDSERYEVIRYARISVMIFLVLLKKARRREIRPSLRKKELLTEIDFAILDTSRRAALEREIDRGMRSFELVVPRTFESKRSRGQYRVTPW